MIKELEKKIEEAKAIIDEIETDIALWKNEIKETKNNELIRTENIKLKDKVEVIKLRPKTREYLGYFKKNVKKILGMKGRVVEILNNGRENQGAKIRFPGGWIWSFYFDELRIREETG